MGTRSLPALEASRLTSLAAPFQAPLRDPGRGPRLGLIAANARSSPAFSRQALRRIPPFSSPLSQPRSCPLLVRKGGLEPPRLAAQAPKACASASSATFALYTYSHHSFRTPRTPANILALGGVSRGLGPGSRHGVVRPPRLERGTCGFEGRRSIQLSYGRRAERISQRVLLPQKSPPWQLAGCRPGRTAGTSMGQTTTSCRLVPHLPTSLGNRCIPSCGAGSRCVITAGGAPNWRRRSSTRNLWSWLPSVMAS